MSYKSNGRRRSLSMNATTYRSQSETTPTSPNSKPKSNFLSIFKSPSSSTTPIVKPSKSASTINSNALPPIHGQQKVKRKPLASNSTQTSESQINSPEEPSKKTTSDSNLQENGNQGNWFREKRSNSIDKNSKESDEFLKADIDTIKTFEKYQLPPISYSDDLDSLSFVNRIMGERTVVLPNNSTYTPQYKQISLEPTQVLPPAPPPHKIETEFIKLSQPVAKPSSYSSRWSVASARKSTGSNSIYSTFGTDSVYSENESSEDVETSTTTLDSYTTKEKDIDLAQIVSSNMQTRSPARVIEPEESDNSSDDDTDDDVFVDATGASQEDIEKERKDRRLSKRLSGGHFGSAGGLLLSIASSEKRASKPPPEDIAKSMMDWKRKSGQNLSKFVFAEQEVLPTQQSNTQIENLSSVPEEYQPRNQVRYSTQKSLPPNSDILEEEEDESLKLADDESDISKASTDALDPKMCASRLWEEDETFVASDQIAEWLGQSKPLNIAALQEYMSYFDFSKLRLDSAFRKVCSKLYFRAEAQQIDRILESFAKRYWSCNPKSILGSSDIVYAVVYSLLLLNTDLHVAQGNYTRMSRHEFVRNTMSTVRDQKRIELKTNPKSANYLIAWETHVESYLKDMYISVKNNQILQPMQHQHEINHDYLNPGSVTLNKRLSIMGGRRMNDIKRGLNTMIHKSGRESMLITDDSAIPRKSTSSSNWRPVSPGGTESVYLSNQDTLLSPNSTYSMDPSGNRPPYFKEGIVMRKHLLESKNQKAKHREWRECLLVVSQGEFKMFGLPGENYNENATSRLQMLKSGGSSFVNLADSLSKSLLDSGSISPAGNGRLKYGAYTQLIGSVELNHTLSNALPPPGYNRSRPFVFALQESNGGVYLIQCASIGQVNEWVSTCNYWAARQSKEPLQGGVGNIEYGWGKCLDDVILDLDAVQKGKKVTGNYIHHPDSVSISVWIPPAPTMISSVLDERAQFDVLQKYVNHLNNEINEHREVKRKMLVKFQCKSQNQSKALSNWESKSTYMLHEIIKYQNYCDALEKSIASQNDESS